MSNERSPREVCSITIGINGLMLAPLLFSWVDWSFQTATSQARSRWLLAAGGPQFRLGRLGFLVGGPDLLAGARDLGGDALRLLGNSVERLAQPQVGAQHLLAAGVEHLLDGVVRIVAGDLRLLADQLADLLVGDLELELARARLEHELAGDRERGLLGHALDEFLGRLARELEVRLGADPAGLERAAEAVQQLAGAVLDERAADLDIRGLDERVDG